MDQERLKRVDSVLEEAVRTGEVAGCNALVLKDGKEVYYGQSGWADKETRQPMARNTIFRLFDEQADHRRGSDDTGGARADGSA